MDYRFVELCIQDRIISVLGDLESKYYLGEEAIHRLKAKTRSELISNQFVISFEDFFRGLGYNLVPEKSDNDPDIRVIVDGIIVPIEVKVTNGENWRGGDYSKRGSNYILISYNFPRWEWYVVLVRLEEEDWVSSEPNRKTGEKNYYATSLKKSYLFDIEDKIEVVGFTEEKMTKAGIPYVRRALLMNKVGLQEC